MDNEMKWAKELMLIRHDTSDYNRLKEQKKKDLLYKQFLAAYGKDANSEETRALALEVREKLTLQTGDADTPLADVEGRQAYETGLSLSSGKLPDVVFVSPYKRTLETLRHITRGWPALGSVKTYEEERIREQEHGLLLLYNDWKVFGTLYPEQRRLREMEGMYWYRYPQGENVPDVRDRNRSWLTTLTRDFSGKRVLAVTHHLNILATRANLERLSAEGFARLDKEETPINCGVTLYQCNPEKGEKGKLELKNYNRKYYE